MKVARLFWYRVSILGFMAICATCKSGSSSRSHSSVSEPKTADEFLGVRGRIRSRTGGGLKPAPRALHDLEAAGTCELLSTTFETLATTQYDISGVYQFDQIEQNSLIDSLTAASAGTVAGFVRCEVTVAGNSRVLMSMLAKPLDEAVQQNAAENGLQVDLNTTSSSVVLMLFGGQDFDPLTATVANEFSYPPALISSSPDIYVLSEFISAMTIAAEATDNAEQDTITSPVASSLNAYIQGFDSYVNGDTDSFSFSEMSEETQSNVAEFVSAVSTMAAMPEVSQLEQIEPESFSNIVMVLLQAEDAQQLNQYADNPTYLSTLVSVVDTLTKFAADGQQNTDNVVPVASALLTTAAVAAASESPAMRAVILDSAQQLISQNEPLDQAYLTVAADALSASVSNADFMASLVNEDNTPNTAQVANFLAYIDIVSAVTETMPVDTSGLDWQEILSTADLENTDYMVPDAQATYGDMVENTILESGCALNIDTDSDSTLDCFDGCPNDANKVVAGVCGCGVADTDSDHDTIPDCNDDPSPMVVSVTATNANGDYKAGSVIAILVTMTEQVTVTGTPTLSLETGTNDQTISYVSLNANSVLVFRYTVQPEDTSEDLEVLATDSLSLNGGTIVDSVSNSAILTLPTLGGENSLSGSKQLRIDTAQPMVLGVATADDSGTYGIGHRFVIEIQFSESVSVTGTPNLTLNTSPVTQMAQYESGSGSSVLQFFYVVAEDDTATALDVDSSTALEGDIRDAAGNLTDLSLDTVSTLAEGGDKTLVVDGIRPVISAVTSTQADGTYGIATNIDIDVAFSDTVYVQNTPQLALNVGDSRGADYLSGSGTSVLTFRYIVAENDSTLDLNYVDTAALTAVDGFITDDIGNDANLTLPATDALTSLGASSDIVVDLVSPSILSVSSPNDSGFYAAGSALEIQIAFSEVVNVVGTPQLTLETGIIDEVIDYVSGSGSSVLSFMYTVQMGDTSAALNYVDANSLTAGTTLRDNAGNDAILTLAALDASGALAQNKTLTIDTTAPNVDAVLSMTANGSYSAGDVIELHVLFSETVDVLGTPVLTLATSGTLDQVVNYASGSGSSALVFFYTVQSGDTSSQLDYVDSNALSVVGVGASIYDAAGNEALPELADVGDAGSISELSELVIDTTAPTVVSVHSPQVDGSYKAGSVIPIYVAFSEAVGADGTPNLTLETGTIDQIVDYTSQLNTTTLVFNYTVQAGDTTFDLSYVQTSSLSASGESSIHDFARNPATLVLPDFSSGDALGDVESLIVDTTAPVVVDVNSEKANGSYTAGEVIDISVLLSEAVTVTGTPVLTLETGNDDGVALYASLSNSSTLVFVYTIRSGDSTPDLNYASTGAFQIADGSIQDGTLNDTDRTLPASQSTGALDQNKDLYLDTSVPTVLSVTTTTSDGSYRAGAAIQLSVLFSEVVFVTGTPELTLETGAIDAVANYVSGSASSLLTFVYTVQTGDTSAQLNYESISALNGLIIDVASNNAALTLPDLNAAEALQGSSNLVIDATEPTVVYVTTDKADGSYTTGEEINVFVAMSENVNVTGTPTLTLETGPTDRVVNYVSGSGSSSLLFIYTVQLGDTTADLDYVDITSLTAGTSIQDGALNDLNRDLPVVNSGTSISGVSDIMIDAAAPIVTSVTSLTTNGAYKAGQSIAIIVTFSETVAVTGTPQLTLETGSTDQVATYVSGSGSTVLSFIYTIQSGDTSADLNYVATNSLVTSGGAINDGSSNQAALTLPSLVSVSSLGGSKALVIDTTPATIASVTSSKANGTYGLGVTIDVRVNFSENVYVTGTPQITLETGATDRVVAYTSGSASSTLVFTYTVQADDTSGDLNYVDTDSFNINEGAIADIGGNALSSTALPALVSGQSLAGTKDLVIETVRPTVTSVSASTADGSYKLASVINVLVNFSEVVTVTGAPKLTLETGATDRTANYTSGSGSTVLLFKYTVQSGDTSADLNYVATNSLIAGTAIRDGALNDVTLTLPATSDGSSLGGTQQIVIDTTVPTVASVTSTHADGTFDQGEVIPITVNFSELVIVTGTPNLTLETGATDRVVNYLSGSGTSALSFDYTIQAGDASLDLNYVSTSSLSAGGGTIRDGATNNATLTLPSSTTTLAANSAIIVDALAPTIATVTSSTLDGIYAQGDVIEIEVVFSEAVIATSTLFELTLETGATDQVLVDEGFSDTSTLVFSYTVQAGDTSSALNYVSTDSLAILSGSITDDVLHPQTSYALPGLESAYALASTKSLVVDTAVPAVVSVSSSKANGAYTTGTTMTIQVNFNEPVVVSGTPKLTLETGATDRVLSALPNIAVPTNITGCTMWLDGQDPLGTGTPPSNGASVSRWTDKAAGHISHATDVAAATYRTSGINGHPAMQFGSSFYNFSNDMAGVFATDYTIISVFNQTAEGTGCVWELGNYAYAADYYFYGIGLHNQMIIPPAHSSTAGNTVTPSGTPYIAVMTMGSTYNNYINGGLSYSSPSGTRTTPSMFYLGRYSDSGGRLSGYFGEFIVYNHVLTTAERKQIESYLSHRWGITSSSLGTNYSQLYPSTLSFPYTVQSGDESVDLNYVDTSSLNLDGGTLTDFILNTGTTTLPALISEQSLAGSKDLVIDTTTPTIANVTSSTSDGSYKLNDVITILVNLSETVTVTGTPQLTLETGSTDRVVTYASGTGTSTLSFRYTVQSGDTTSDLNFVATDSLTAGTSIRDVVLLDAVRTLPATSAGESLGGGKQIVIDTTAPTVTSVASTHASGTYGIGQVIPITVNFSEFVVVTGTPRLTLETGATDQMAVYASGTGTTALVFNYTVQAGDSTADLDYVDTTSLSGTIADGAGNDATLSLPTGGSTLAGVKDFVLDTVVPTISSVTTDSASGTYTVGSVINLYVTFSKPMYVVGEPQLTLETGIYDEVIDYSDGGLGTSVLTFTYTVQLGDDTADLEYVAIDSLTLNGATLSDVAGNTPALTLPVPGTSLAISGSKDIVIDTTAPSSPSISINSGAAYAITTEATLTLSATGATQMLISSASDCSTGSWVTYATSTDYTLLSSNATNTVYVRFRDDIHNMSSCVSDSIVHDSLVPTTPGSVDDGTGSDLESSSAITWTESTDSGSGLSEYQVAIGTTSGTNDVMDWTSVGTSLSASFSSLTLSEGVTYYAAVRAIDNAGHISSLGLGDGWTASASYGNVPSTWSMQAFLKAPNAAADYQYGSSVAIYSDTIAVGSWYEDSSQNSVTNGTGAATDNLKNRSGAVYVVKRSGSSWQQEAYLKAANPDALDSFGIALAMHSDTIVVGATEEASNQDSITNGPTASTNNTSSQAGAAYVFRRNGTTWAQEAYLKASNNTAAGDFFGVSVAIDGDTIVVGAEREDGGGPLVNGPLAGTDNSVSGSGAAYVYRRTGTTWEQEAYLKAINRDINDNFGHSVAISGDTIAVGAPGEDSIETTITNGTGASSNNSFSVDAGAVYVYRRAGSSWTQEAYIKSSNGTRLFNLSSISGDTLVISAPYESGNQLTITNGTGSTTDFSAAGRGAAFVFKRTGTTWAQEAYLKPSNSGQDYASFGIAHSIDADTIVVGAYGESGSDTTVTNGTKLGADSSITGAGAAYVFKRTGSTWDYQAYLKAPSISVYDSFGGSTAVYGNTVVVGASAEDSNQTTITNGTTASTDNSASAAGAAYVYIRE